MSIRKFTIDFLDEVVEEGKGLVEDSIIDTTRWGIVHQVVFEAYSELWMVIYEDPATEMTEVERWIADMDDRVVAHRVVAVSQMVTKYQKVSP